MNKSPKKLQDKIQKLYNRIDEDLYLSRPDIDLGKSKYNSNLLLGILTNINDGTMLSFGPYGGGKTTLVSYLNSIMYGLPIETTRKLILQGDSQKIREEFIGRPDYETWETIWRHFCLVKPKIIDELPRIPESSQSSVLSGIADGNWSYNDENIQEGKRPIYATANYKDRGSYTILPALLDRFDLATVSSFPGVINTMLISNKFNGEQEEVLKDKVLHNKIIEILNSRNSYEKIQQELQEIRNNFSNNISKEGFPHINDEEKIEIKEQIKEVNFDPLSRLYLLMLTAELNIPNRGNYLRKMIETSCESRRLEKSIVQYSKSLAWLEGRKTTTLDDVTTIAPYTLWHRIEWSGETLGHFAEVQDRRDRDLYITKKLLGEGKSQELEGLKKRVINQNKGYNSLMKLIKEEKVEDAKLFCTKLSANGLGHPLYEDLCLDL